MYQSTNKETEKLAEIDEEEAIQEAVHDQDVE